MSRLVGGATITGSGNVAFTGVGFQPNYIRITLSQKGTDSQGHISVGCSDGTNQLVHSTYSDTTGSKTVRSTSKIVSHYERVSGTITEVINASFVSFDADGFTLNIATGNANYQAMVECFA